ncbi:MAG TPA: M56 family metallopeptidase [Gemmatimonadaceae bacterium]|nr:M56 family metallopeptidase [Gemmatimonadaceae bacterium]
MSLSDFARPEHLIALVPAVAAALLKGAVILVFGTACSVMARGASAAARHLIWTLTLGGALAAPVVSAVLPRWTVHVGFWPIAAEMPVVASGLTVPAALTGPSTNAVLALAPRSDAVAIAASDTPVAVVPGPATAEAALSLGDGRATTLVPMDAEPSVAADPVSGAVPEPGTGQLIAWLATLWALGVVISLMPTVAAFARLAILARRARPVRGGRWALLIPSALRELDVRRRVRFVELDGPIMPMTWGVFRPVVLLPADDFDSTIEQRLDVLRHELAHVRRYDCLTQLVGQLACALHWFNPFAWVAARELRVERERACDDEVLGAGAKASDYADYLLRVARSTRIVGATVLGGLAMARPSQMAGRLLAVLDDRRRRGRVPLGRGVQAGIVAGALVTGVAAASPVSAAATDPAPAVAAGQGNSTAAIDNGIAVGPVRLDEPTRAHDLAAAPSAVAASHAPCDARAGNDNGSHTNSINSDNGSKRWVVQWSDGDCSYEMEARGEVKFNRDVTDIESISSGGSFTLEQHVGDDAKRLLVRPRDDGTLERSYSENGARHEFDAAARAWFAAALVALDRQTGFAVDQRVPALLERGGVDAVLQEVKLVSTDYARRRYYTKLLSMRQLDRGQIKRVVEQAGADMSSDYELAELLVTVSKLDAFGDDSHAAFVAAAKKIDSDYERRRALDALLQRDRLAPATVQALLDAASTIQSDYELAELLIDVSKRYAINDQTRPTYIKALGSVKSDYEHRRVLSAIVAGGGLTPAVNRTLLQDAARIQSDYELAEFLILMGKNGGLDASTRDAYFAAADKIGSDYEHRRALTPLVTRDLLTKDLAKSIMASAAKIDSDYECSELLIAIANAITIDDDLRPAFEKAADTIQGEYEYGRAMSSVRRRVTK